MRLGNICQDDAEVTLWQRNIKHDTLMHTHTFVRRWNNRLHPRPRLRLRISSLCWACSCFCNIIRSTKRGHFAYAFTLVRRYVAHSQSDTMHPMVVCVSVCELAQIKWLFAQHDTYMHVARQLRVAYAVIGYVRHTYTLARTQYFRFLACSMPYLFFTPISMRQCCLCVAFSNRHAFIIVFAEHECWTIQSRWILFDLCDFDSTLSSDKQRVHSDVYVCIWISWNNEKRWAYKFEMDERIYFCEAATTRTERLKINSTIVRSKQMLSLLTKSHKCDVRAMTKDSVVTEFN